MVTAAMPKMPNLGTNLGTQVQDLTQTVRDRATTSMADVGTLVSDLAQSVREVRPGEVLGELAAEATGRLGRLPSPPRPSGPSFTGIVGFAVGMLFRQPLRSLLFGLAVGYLLGFAIAGRRQRHMAYSGERRVEADSGGNGSRADALFRERAREAKPDIPPPSAGRAHDDTKVDVMSMDSFPASDPPSTLGSSMPSD